MKRLAGLVSTHTATRHNSNLIIVPLHFGRHDEDQESFIMLFDMAGKISTRYEFQRGKITQEMMVQAVKQIKLVLWFPDF